MIYSLLQLDFQTNKHLKFSDAVVDAYEALGTRIEEVMDDGEKILCPILLVNQQVMDSILGSDFVPATTLQELWTQGAASVLLSSSLLEYVEEVYPTGELSVGQSIICLDIERIYSLSTEGNHLPQIVLQTLWHRERVRSSWGLQSHNDGFYPGLWNLLYQEVLRWAQEHDESEVILFLKDVSANVTKHSLEPIGLQQIRKHTLVTPRFTEPKWSELIQELQNAQFKCFQIQADPPEKPKRTRRGHLCIHQELFDILPNQEEGLHRESTGDTLALYVAQDSRTGLKKGIHLFCDRIESAAKHNNIPLEVLIWQVFWHELTHWKLDDSKDPCGKRSFLQAFDIREVFCEITAMEALRGSESFLHPTLKTPKSIRHVDTSHIIRWRQNGNLNPYSWFLGMYGYKSIVPQEIWFRAILHWSQKQYQLQQKLEQGLKPSLIDKAVLRDVFNLFTAKTTVPLAKKQIENAAQQSQIVKNWLGQPIVYLWRKNG